jgi:hypothetical protein
MEFPKEFGGQPKEGVVLDPTRAPPRPPEPPNTPPQAPQVPPSPPNLGGLGGAWDREFDPAPPPPKPALAHLWAGPTKFIPSVVFTARPAQR